jgi:hypothetical protein|tara:strand:+ start:403 stop:870 length:468 start_codon:yes stop_codon:yes gene_type:complete
MYKKYGSNDFETHKLEVTLLHNQTAKAGGWDYKSMSKVQMYDTTAKRKYSPYQFHQWLETPHIMAMIKKGANLKIATYDYEDNPTKYDDGNRRKIVFYFSALKNPPKRNENIDGLKPIGQSVPRYTEQPMTQAQPSAPDHATTAQLSDLDDEIPF